MQLTEARSRELLRTHGVYVESACDRCGVAIGPFNRFTRYGETGVWCSRECRDGKEALAPGVCKGCGAALEGKRRGAKYCSDVCRKRQQVQDSRIIPETHIQNKQLAGAISRSGCTHSQNATAPVLEALS